jgi:pilus assembly protein Flp/PilA
MLFAAQEKGQGLVEYALILVLIAIVVIIALTALGEGVGNIFNTINNDLKP